MTQVVYRRRSHSALPNVIFALLIGNGLILMHIPVVSYSNGSKVIGP